jgi:predicted PurR-regulated permease PerM
MPTHIEAPGPNELRDPLVREELKRAGVWIGLVVGVLLIWVLAQPLLLIIGGIVFAAMLDGGTRLLGRVLPLPRRLRLLIVALLVIAFLAWVMIFAGTQIVDQAQQVQDIVNAQIGKVVQWAQHQRLLKTAVPVAEVGREIFSSLGRLTTAVGSVIGVFTSILLIVVIGVFLAIEPRLYERGVAWMLPLHSRDNFYGTASAIGATLRRLMAGRLFAMLIEGFGTWTLLSIGNVPMASLLGLLTGLFAFLPNIGALISGALMVLVGFSGGTDTGLWAIGVYFIVHAIDGYVIVPMVAKRSVDLAPALVLSAQLLLGALLGILGLILADPIVAMIKVALERGSESSAERAEATED